MHETKPKPSHTPEQIARARAALTERQILLAKELLAKRPAVIPGTRAIINEDEKNTWFEEVFKTKDRMRIKSRESWALFCDIAGVPD